MPESLWGDRPYHLPMTDDGIDLDRRVVIPADPGAQQHPSYHRHKCDHLQDTEFLRQFALGKARLGPWGECSHCDPNEQASSRQNG